MWLPLLLSFLPLVKLITNNEEIKEDSVFYIKLVPIVIEDNNTFITYHQMSPKVYAGIGGVPVKCILENDNISFVCSLNVGSFVWGKIINTEIVDYKNPKPYYLYLVFDDDVDHAYLQIVIKEGNNIIGLVLLNVKIYDENFFELTTLISIKFPKVSHKYQYVTENYINNLIDSLEK